MIFVKESTNQVSEFDLDALDIALDNISEKLAQRNYEISLINTPEKIEKWWAENKEKLDSYADTLKSFLRATKAFRRDKYTDEDVGLKPHIFLEFISEEYLDFFKPEIKKTLCDLSNFGRDTSVTIFSVGGGPRMWANLSAMANWFAEHYPEVEADNDKELRGVSG